MRLSADPCARMRPEGRVRDSRRRPTQAQRFLRTLFRYRDNAFGTRHRMDESRIYNPANFMPRRKALDEHYQTLTDQEVLKLRAEGGFTPDGDSNRRCDSLRSGQVLPSHRLDVRRTRPRVAEPGSSVFVVPGSQHRDPGQPAIYGVNLAGGKLDTLEPCCIASIRSRRRRFG